MSGRSRSLSIGTHHRSAAGTRGRLGVDPGACAVVGDADEDVVAGLAAGARAVLVPNGTTSGGALRWAPEVEPTIEGAVDLLLHGSRGGAAR